ncbi:N-acetylmuramoyl-L-alanine amidase family protein [Flavobacterium rhizosphaerae]|uniref:N-acetylmuramoyl-L-alanine amidase n=1 Tax=Flavobacterium rhizosphaerae TaxID=3163298 RepID=A0ABW8YZK8_9FLAO
MKKLFKFFVLTAVAACFAFVVPNETKTKEINIVIDAGHGGKDFGAKYNDIIEKEITNEIAQKINELNKNSNIVIHFTRFNDNFVDLNERVNTINSLKPDLLISLHVNSQSIGTERSGMEFFVYDKNAVATKSAQYAESLAQQFKEANYNVGEVKTASMYLLKNSESPAIIFEMGYLTNQYDRAYLTNENNKEKIARTILDFVASIE